jgi:hypothetical protein
VHAKTKQTGEGQEVIVMPSRRIAVFLEVTQDRTVASALGWPGWCRAARDEGAALEALAGYAGRYAPVAGRAGVSFPATVAFDVVERARRSRDRVRRTRMPPPVPASDGRG